jgi:hypothetical protein
MAFLVEQDIALDPFLIGLFGAVGIVFEADGVADLIEEFLAPGRLGGDLRHVDLV